MRISDVAPYSEEEDDSELVGARSMASELIQRVMAAGQRAPGSEANEPVREAGSHGESGAIATTTMEMISP